MLKWRAAGADEGALPLAVTCWPSLSGGDAYVNLEYEARAAFLELRGNFALAQAVYDAGLFRCGLACSAPVPAQLTTAHGCRRTQPLERLQAKFASFQARMVRSRAELRLTRLPSLLLRTLIGTLAMPHRRCARSASVKRLHWA